MGGILIVEDDDDIREELAAVLAEEGYEVATAANGALALEALAGSARPRLILLDLMMPQMSGWDFRTRQLADPRLAAIPVVVLSGAASVVRSAASLKAAGYLTKPFRLADLLETVTRLCTDEPAAAKPTVSSPS